MSITPDLEADLAALMEDEAKRQAKREAEYRERRDRYRKLSLAEKIAMLESYLSISSQVERRDCRPVKEDVHVR